MENIEVGKGEKFDNIRTGYGRTIENLDVYQYLPTPTPEDSELPYIFRGSVSPTSWDNDELLDSYSQRSSPALVEEPWTLPYPSMPSSTSNSPSLYSPRPEELYPSYFVKHEYLVEADNYTAKKSTGPRPPKASADLALASVNATETRPLDHKDTARNHPLYHNVAPKADGLYHCPFEDDPAANCTHKPEKLKSNYDKFVDSHLRPYRCKISICKDLTFSSTACLLRHERVAHAMHGHGDRPYLCTHEGCERGVSGNGFPRHWNLRDHMKRVHGDFGLAKNGDPENPFTPMNQGKKRKADVWEESKDEAPMVLVVEEEDPSLIDRYREQQQKLVRIVQELRDPRRADNLALLQDATECVEIMAQIVRRINSGPAVAKKTRGDKR